MDLNLTPRARAFREALRAWLAENLPPPWTGARRSEDNGEYGHHPRSWQQGLFDGGWAGISWPREYGGGGATPTERSILLAEFAMRRLAADLDRRDR